jgi:hypothetical protein
LAAVNSLRVANSGVFARQLRGDKNEAETFTDKDGLLRLAYAEG